MIALVPTPARAAGLGDTTDEPGHPPISTPAAVLMIGAAYLLFFGRGILNALDINRTGQVLPALDYSDFPGVQDTVTRLAQIAGALLILWLFCRHLQVPRELAGIPRYPASPIRHWPPWASPSSACCRPTCSLRGRVTRPGSCR
jgi:hypothetical protein